jgi:hypothetical protein
MCPCFQGCQIDFGIDFGGLGELMSEDLADLRQGGTSTKHLDGQRMAKQMSSLVCGLKASPNQSPSNYVADGNGAGKAHVRCLHPNENTARNATRTPILQIQG